VSGREVLSRGLKVAGVGSVWVRIEAFERRLEAEVLTEPGRAHLMALELAQESWVAWGFPRDLDHMTNVELRALLTQVCDRLKTAIGRNLPATATSGSGGGTRAPSPTMTTRPDPPPPAKVMPPQPSITARRTSQPQPQSGGRATKVPVASQPPPQPVPQPQRKVATVSSRLYQPPKPPPPPGPNPRLGASCPPAAQATRHGRSAGQDSGSRQRLGRSRRQGPGPRPWGVLEGDSPGWVS
jgi:hypothetical protein